MLTCWYICSCYCTVSKGTDFDMDPVISSGDYLWYNNGNWEQIFLPDRLGLGYLHSLQSAQWNQIGCSRSNVLLHVKREADSSPLLEDYCRTHCPECQMIKGPAFVTRNSREWRQVAYAQQDTVTKTSESGQMSQNCHRRTVDRTIQITKTKKRILQQQRHESQDGSLALWLSLSERCYREDLWRL